VTVAEYNPSSSTISLGDTIGTDEDVRALLPTPRVAGQARTRTV
jgi:hypothetical protein